MRDGRRHAGRSERGGPGSVTGIDLSTSMLAVAEGRARDRGIGNVDFLRADAQVHPFAPSSFDVAISSFGVMFFADPTAAFANVAGALRPDGRLVAVVWRALADNEWLTEIRAALAAGRDLPTPPPGAPGPFGLADPDAATEVLRGAGFVDVRLERVDEPMDFGDDVDDAYAFVSSFGIARGLTQPLDDATRAEALARLRTMLEAHASPDGVVLGSSAWLVTARTPDVDRGTGTAPEGDRR